MGRREREKNIIRQRGILGEKGWRGGYSREKSIVLNCIPNMSHLAEIRFSEKHAALGKTESLKTRSSCNVE